MTGSSSEGETGRSVLVALSTNEGRERWRTDLAFAPKDLAVAGDRCYVGGRRRGVVALADGG